MKYILEVDERQLRVMQEALDMFFRGGMHQFDYMIEHVLRNSDMRFDRDLTQGIETSIKNLIREKYPEEATGRNTYYGITSDKIAEEFRIACYIHDVIRNKLAWDIAKEEDPTVSEANRAPSMIVDYDPPNNWSEHKEEAKLKKKEKL